MTSEPNECRNSILVTCHYPYLGSSSDWLKQMSLSPRPIRSTSQTGVVHVISMEFLRSCLRRHFAEKSVGVAECRLFSQAKFLRLLNQLTIFVDIIIIFTDVLLISKNWWTIAVLVILGLTQRGTISSCRFCCWSKPPSRSQEPPIMKSDSGFATVR